MGTSDSDEDSAEACDFPAIVKRSSEKALCCSVEVSKGKYKEVWIPMSQIHDDSEVYDATTKRGKLVIPAWLAREKGLL